MRHPRRPADQRVHRAARCTSASARASSSRSSSFGGRTWRDVPAIAARHVRGLRHDARSARAALVPDRGSRHPRGSTAARRGRPPARRRSPRRGTPARDRTPRPWSAAARAGERARAGRAARSAGARRRPDGKQKLRRADLRGADLRGALLIGADLRGSRPAAGRPARRGPARGANSTVRTSTDTLFLTTSAGGVRPRRRHHPTASRGLIAPGHWSLVPAPCREPRGGSDHLMKDARHRAPRHHTGGTEMQTISPFLWFDDQAEQAAERYVVDLPELPHRRRSPATARALRSRPGRR